MPYTIFERRIKRVTSPSVSLVKQGRIVMNKTAAGIVSNTGATHVHLLWDGEAHRFALRPVFKKDDPRAYSVHYGNGPQSTVGGSVNAKTFLDHIGIDYRATRAYAAHWNEKEGLLEVTLPEEAFTNRQQPLVEVPRRTA